MDPKRILGFVIALAIGIGFVVYRGQSDKAVQAKAAVTADQVSECCHNCPSYAKNQAFFDEFEDTAHEQAYDAAYQSSGRRRSAKFDEAAYCRCFFKVLIHRAELKNKRDLCDELRQAQIEAEKVIAAK